VIQRGRKALDRLDARFSTPDRSEKVIRLMASGGRWTTGSSTFSGALLGPPGRDAVCGRDGSQDQARASQGRPRHPLLKPSSGWSHPTRWPLRPGDPQLHARPSKRAARRLRLTTKGHVTSERPHASSHQGGASPDEFPSAPLPGCSHPDGRRRADQQLRLPVGVRRSEPLSERAQRRSSSARGRG
jgi:hypothetical protein